MHCDASQRSLSQEGVQGGSARQGRMRAAPGSRLALVPSAGQHLPQQARLATRSTRTGSQLDCSMGKGSAFTSSLPKCPEMVWLGIAIARLWGGGLKPMAHCNHVASIWVTHWGGDATEHYNRQFSLFSCWIWMIIMSWPLRQWSEKLFERESMAWKTFCFCLLPSPSLGNHQSWKHRFTAHCIAKSLLRS